MITLFPSAAEQLYAVHLRHDDVCEHQIRRVAPDHLERLTAVAGFTCHRKSELFPSDDFTNRFANEHLVFDQ
ncbi:hypothetical protein D3C74_430740 [compost metagenome]